MGKWEQELNLAMPNLQKKTFTSVILRILRVAWCACLYFIWKERNARWHDSIASTINCVAQSIVSLSRIEFKILIFATLLLEMETYLIFVTTGNWFYFIN